MVYNNKSTVIENFGRHVSAGKVKFFLGFGMDFVPGKREGCYLYDLDGKAFLNCHCNGGVFNLGHRNPKIIAATRIAMEMWDMGNHHLISAPGAMLGARLAELLPGDINRTVFGVSGGSEIGCFTTLAVLEETTKPGFLVHVNEMVEFYRQQLTELQRQFPRLLIEIRQKGLMMGLKFPVEKISMGMCKLLYDNGVFVVYSGNDTTVVQFLPPLIINQKEAEFTIEVLQKSLVQINNMIQ